MALLSCWADCGHLSFHTEVNALASVGIYSFSDVATHLLSPAEGTGTQGPVAPSEFGGRKERAEVH